MQNPNTAPKPTRPDLLTNHSFSGAKTDEQVPDAAAQRLPTAGEKTLTLAAVKDRAEAWRAAKARERPVPPAKP